MRYIHFNIIIMLIILLIINCGNPSYDDGTSITYITDIKQPVITEMFASSGTIELGDTTVIIVRVKTFDNNPVNLVWNSDYGVLSELSETDSIVIWQAPYSPGVYTIHVHAENNYNLSDTKNIEIVVNGNAPPAAEIIQPEINQHIATNSSFEAELKLPATESNNSLFTVSIYLDTQLVRNLYIYPYKYTILTDNLVDTHTLKFVINSSIFTNTLTLTRDIYINNVFSF